MIWQAMKYRAIMAKKVAEPPKAIMVTGVRLGWKSLSLRTPPTRQKRMVLMLPRDMTEVEAAASRPEAGQEEGEDETVADGGDVIAEQSEAQDPEPGEAHGLRELVHLFPTIEKPLLERLGELPDVMEQTHPISQRLLSELCRKLGTEQRGTEQVRQHGLFSPIF